MRGYDRVLRIGHSGNLLHLENSTGMNDIRLNDVRRPMLKDLAVLVVCKTTFSSSGWNVDPRPYIGESGNVFRWDRFFKPTRTKGLQVPCHLDSGGLAEPAMTLYKDLHFRTNRIANCFDESDSVVF